MEQQDTCYIERGLCIENVSSLHVRIMSSYSCSSYFIEFFHDAAGHLFDFVVNIMYLSVVMSQL